MSTATCPKCFNLNPEGAERCSRCGAVLGEDAAVGFLPEMMIADNYRLVRRIGEGGMGEVWEAVQTSIGRTVAMKFLHAELMKHPTARRRVVGEGRALGKLGHPNVVNIVECFETENTVALALEFIEGGSLADRIEADGAVPWATAVDWMDAILKGLGAIHRAGLIHRDIKPDNILLAVDEDDGHMLPKVTDLGIAHDEEGTRLTRDGSRLGTPEYMAPEQIKGLAVDARCDLYAAGIMLYEMLTGAVPFAGTDYDIMDGHMKQSPDLARLPSDVPEWLKNALMRSLAKSPDERFDDYRAFRAALTESGDVGASEAPAAVPPVAPPRGPCLSLKRQRPQRRAKSPLRQRRHHRHPQTPRTGKRRQPKV